MKIQCSCGAKYAFDATPEMLTNPVGLICQNCNTDLSGHVNELIRQQFAPPPPPAEPEPAPPRVEPIPGAKSGAIRITAKASPKPRLSIHKEEPKVEAAAPVAEGGETVVMCARHPKIPSTERCVICQKPICLSCMELFGYVCSPHCRAKASANGIDVPVYENERSQVAARFRSKMVLGVGSIGLVVAALIGFWAWYVVAGRLPHSYYAVRFEKTPARSGGSILCPDQQLVFLHGATLARHDLKTRKPVWTQELFPPLKDEREETKWLYYMVIGNLQLRVQGQNIWVFSPGKLTRYDWNTGEVKQSIPLEKGEAMWQGDEALLVDSTPGDRSVTHISLATGDSTVEHVRESAISGKQRRTTTLATTKTSRPTRFLGLPDKASDKNLDTPLDPSVIAAQVQSMSLPARIALPATLSVSMNQERLFREMASQDNPTPTKAPADNPLLLEDYSLIPQKEGCLQFSTRLLEERVVTRSAMKAKPTKSALDGKVNAAASATIANELLNEIQREHGGDTVTENQSRYWVTLRRADDKVSADWTGEVTGEPGLMPLDTVNVLCAGEAIVVFDKANKKLWEAKLTFPVPLERYSFRSDSADGAGPCVERDGALYVADKGVLTAFDAQTGNVRWRLPSVGIAGMHFDEAGMIYLNTTTADLDSIKFERQIDITKRQDEVVMKIDPRTGKQLWTAQPGGFINYVAGKYLFVVSKQAGDFDENGDSVYGIDTGLEKSALVNIKRLDPKDGKLIWRYQQQRYPLDLTFQQNEIMAVFRREVQVLKFMAF